MHVRGSGGREIDPPVTPQQQASPPPQTPDQRNKSPGLLERIEREIPALEVQSSGFDKEDGEGTLVRPMSRPSRDPDTLVRPMSRGDRSSVPPPRPSQPKHLPNNYQRSPSPPGEPTPPPRER